MLLSLIIARLNEVFITDGLTDKDLVNYAYIIRDKVRENARVMTQIANNTPDQVMLGGCSGADFKKLIFDLLQLAK